MKLATMESAQQSIPPQMSGLNFIIAPDKKVGIPYKTRIIGLMQIIAL